MSPTEVFVLSTRETAILFWTAVIGIAVLVKMRDRSALWNLIRATLVPGILIPAAILTLYTAGVVWLLHAGGFWTTELVKETVIWFLGVGLLLPFATLMKSSSEPLTPRFVRRGVSAIIVLEYVIATYTFSLPVEMLIVPVATAIAFVEMVARMDRKTVGAANFLTGVLALMGFVVLGLALREAISEYQVSDLSLSLRVMALPVVLTLALVPFTYALLCYSSLDTLLRRLKRGQIEDARVRRYAALRLFGLCLNRSKAASFISSGRSLGLMTARTRADVDALFALSRELQ